MNNLITGNNIYIFGGAVALSSFSFLYGLRRYFQGPVCKSTIQLNRKIVVITGANTGIGLETAIDMAKRKATVIAACRDEQKGLEAVTLIREKAKNSSVYFYKLDLASLESIKEFSAKFLTDFKKLDILINNAGVMMCPYSKTKDGFEMQIGTNHFGHFALTMLLLERIKESSPSRIVNLSSNAHYRVDGIDFENINSDTNYNALNRYCQSKLGNVWFTKELARKLEGTGITTFALHPGVVRTELGRYFPASLRKLLGLTGMLMFFKTPFHGAQTSIYCAVTPGLEDKTGEYFADCAYKKSSKQSYDTGMQKKFWDISESMTGIKYPF